MSALSENSVNTASNPPQLKLIPWDPSSSSHKERLYQQRLQCGWKSNLVESVWPAKQEDGTIALQWIILSPSDPDYDAKMATHLSAFPAERIELSDTAASLGGKSRIPNIEKKFIPIGHISLDTEYEKPGVVEKREGTYFVASFYISKALQHSGLGRASMDLIERTAADEPLCARVLSLSCVAREYEGKEERWKALGKEQPKISNHDWYERRGYNIFRTVDALYSDKDATGKLWPVTAVFMSKDIRGGSISSSAKEQKEKLD